MSDGMKYWMQEREEGEPLSTSIRQTRDSMEAKRKKAEDDIERVNSELEALQKCCPHEHTCPGDTMPTTLVCLDCGKILK